MNCLRFTFCFGSGFLGLLLVCYLKESFNILFVSSKPWISLHLFQITKAQDLSVPLMIPLLMTVLDFAPSNS